LHEGSVVKIPFDIEPGQPCKRDERCFSKDIFDGAVLFFSISGGRADQYAFAAINRSSLSGAELHALHAFTESKPAAKLYSESWVSIACDLVIGVVFLFGVRLFAMAGTLVPYKTVFFLCVTLFPLILGLAIAYILITCFVPFMYSIGFWVSPAYVLVGMVMHTYFELGEKNLEHINAVEDTSMGPSKVKIENQIIDESSVVNHRAHDPDFTFGLIWWFNERTSYSTWRLIDECLSATIPFLIVLATCFYMLVLDSSPLVWQKCWFAVALVILVSWSLRRNLKNLKGGLR
jgi:hypothetical protein